MSNLRAGSNQPDYAAEVLARLAEEYPDRSVADLVEGADELPKTVESSDDVATVSAYVKKCRDYINGTEASRKAEKEVFLRSGEAVDSYFGKLIEKVRSLRVQLERRVDRFKQAQLAEERRKREELARKAREAAEHARRQQEEAERAQREAELAASRARRRDTVEQRGKELLRAEQVASAAHVDATLARTAAHEAADAANASAAEMTRERFEHREGGGLVSMKMAPFVMIEDRNKLDFARLAPYFRDEAVEYALRAWAKATNYQEKMPGAIAEMRETTFIK